MSDGLGLTPNCLGFSRQYSFRPVAFLVAEISCLWNGRTKKEIGDV